jgi:aminobenzoyl-glutamate utilization protein B
LLLGYDQRPYWSRIYTFEGEHLRRGRAKPRAGRWCSPDRAGARRGRRRVPDVYKLEDDEEVDAAHAGSWTLNEFIPIAGQAAADNIAPTIGQIQYAMRANPADVSGDF